MEKPELNAERAGHMGINKQISQKERVKERMKEKKEANSPTGLADIVNKHHSYCSLSICQVLYCF